MSHQSSHTASTSSSQAPKDEFDILLEQYARGFEWMEQQDRMRKEQGLPDLPPKAVLWERAEEVLCETEPKIDMEYDPEGDIRKAKSAAREEKRYRLLNFIEERRKKQGQQGGSGGAASSSKTR